MESHMLFEQVEWAERTLLDRSYIHNISNTRYFAKDITIDYNTLELRISFFSGLHNGLIWDIPLIQFLNDFSINNFR